MKNTHKIMKRLFPIVMMSMSLILSPKITNASTGPNIQFIKDIGDAGSDWITSVQQTSDGGFIAVGGSNSSDGDFSEFTHGDAEALIIKLDDKGNTVWLKNIGGSGYDCFNSVKQTSDGGFIAVGKSSSSDDDFDGLNKGSDDAIAAKFDSNGNLSWIKNFGGSDGDIFNSIQQTKDGGFIAVGQSNSNDGDFPDTNKGSSDAIAVKLDSNGNPLWIKNFGGTGYDVLNSVQTIDDGSFIAVGSSGSSDEDLDGLNKGDNDAIAVKLDTNGNIAWIKSFGGSDTESFNSVQKTSDGSFIAVGSTRSNDGDFNGLNKGEEDAIITKLDSSGNLLWAKTFGGSDIESFNSVQETSNGQFVAVGSTYSNDNNLNGLNKGSNDAIIVNFDSKGIFKWVKDLGGLDGDSFSSVQQTSDGGFIASGLSASSDGDFTDLNHGNNDMIFVRFATDIPTITINPYVTTPTNKNIVVTASVENGTLNSTSHTFTGNRQFTFTATSDSGTKVTKTISIKNIDKIAPNLILTQSKPDKKGNVLISIKASDNWSGIQNIKLPDGSVKTDIPSTWAVTEDKTYVFTLTDNAGNSVTKSITVSNIGKSINIKSSK